MKTAISLPDETFERVTRRANDLGMSRSEFFTRAAQRYLDDLDALSLTEHINSALERLVGPDEDQTVCPYAPPSPPPLPSLPPSPSSPVVTESTGIEEGTLIGVVVAAVVVALILLAGICCLVAKEKAGKPIFTNVVLDNAPDSKA